ncbi:MAG TPA: hypothetical protein VFA15_00835, partial [Nitrososphaera sp.]|nr:hypothetical protein [Nitrososphaera sp.]
NCSRVLIKARDAGPVDEGKLNPRDCTELVVVVLELLLEDKGCDQLISPTSASGVNDERRFLSSSVSRYRGQKRDTLRKVRRALQVRPNFEASSERNAGNISLSSWMTNCIRSYRGGKRSVQAAWITQQEQAQEGSRESPPTQVIARYRLPLSGGKNLSGSIKKKRFASWTGDGIAQ